MSCIDCVEPPPDMILSMPPPPLPSFLLPNTAKAAVTGHNESGNAPCFATLVCDSNGSGDRERSGIELIELSQKDDTWLFILVSSCAGFILVVTLLAMILVKCKKSYSYYGDTNVTKHPPIASSVLPGAGGRDNDKRESDKNPRILYPFVPSSNYQKGNHGNDNRMLWATLTPRGTQHFITEPGPFQDDHYEVIDYHNRQLDRKNLKNSFENNGFVDFDYEDPTPLMDSYKSDVDSGYQEPHNIYNEGSGSSLRGAYVSTPTLIENPNIAALNGNQTFGTLNTLKKQGGGTLGRRNTSEMMATVRSLKV